MLELDTTGVLWMESKESVRIELSGELLAVIDKLREELGLRSRAGLIEKLLEELLLSSSEEQEN